MTQRVKDAMRSLWILAAKSAATIALRDAVIVASHTDNATAQAIGEMPIDKIVSLSLLDLETALKQAIAEETASSMDTEFRQ